MFSETSEADRSAVIGQAYVSAAQKDILQTEAYLSQNFKFRFNVLSNKVEFQCLNAIEDIPVSDGVIFTSKPHAWEILNDRILNSIIRRTKIDGVSKSNPSQNIERYINSTATAIYNPVLDWLSQLPEWDGINRVAELFDRIPGITTKQIYWCSIWLRGVVAQWMQMNSVHGNEIVPLFIGKQGSGKTTFCLRILPDELREYFLDHINFNNKFDSDMALTNNLLVNIDEFDRFNSHKQADLKQTLSRVRVNSRPIYGSIEEDRPRFASFTATTNDAHPLADTTGSRRFICIRISKDNRLDYESPIDYQQLYSQVVYELKKGERYWLTQEETFDLQNSNLPYQKSKNLEDMIIQCYSIPGDTTTIKPILMKDILQKLKETFPESVGLVSSSVNIGRTLKQMECPLKHTANGQAYYLEER